jgi:hypothetical protein
MKTEYFFIVALTSSEVQTVFDEPGLVCCAVVLLDVLDN